MGGGLSEGEGEPAGARDALVQDPLQVLLGFGGVEGGAFFWRDEEDFEEVGGHFDSGDVEVRG